MAKKNKEKQYSEAELIDIFGLERRVGNAALQPRLQEWIQAEATLEPAEQSLFAEILQDAIENINTWQEEDLKMLFISFVLRLGHLRNHSKYHIYFEKTISAVVEGTFLKTKTDCMVATGILNMPKKPFFHFQEYKPQLNPTGEPMAQLLEAFLIAQTKNQTTKPLYGCEVIGKQWTFVVMEGKVYSVSPSYDCTDASDLLKIIAILRKFKEILETELLD
jgi:hypothetical protein